MFWKYRTKFSSFNWEMKPARSCDPSSPNWESRCSVSGSPVVIDISLGVTAQPMVRAAVCVALPEEVGTLRYSLMGDNITTIGFFSSESPLQPAPTPRHTDILQTLPA